MPSSRTSLAPGSRILGQVVVPEWAQGFGRALVPEWAQGLGRALVAEKAEWVLGGLAQVLLGHLGSPERLAALELPLVPELPELLAYLAAQVVRVH